MFKQRLFRTLCAMVMAMTFVSVFGASAASRWVEDEWYLIRFMNGGNAFTATTDGAQISTTKATASDAQLWKIEGNEEQGYELTNKLGLKLYVPSAATNSMVSAASAPTGHTRFVLTETENASYAGGLEIHPIENAAVSMNLWGGPNENRGVGLWNAGDQNNPVRLTTETEFKSVGKISLVPYPQQLKVVKEGDFDFAQVKTIVALTAEAKTCAADFAKQWTLVSGVDMQIVDADCEGMALRMMVDESQPAEGYALAVAEDGVTIKASEAAGFFYAVQTLKQLLPRAFFADKLQADVVWTLPYVAIEDAPILGHRGFMMDVARHFFTKEEVKRVLDIMSLYKMNRFHWHLTDDQGWRIEIPEYPLLTEVGAIRSGSFTSPGDGTKFFDDTEYGRGMYFTLDELKDIVAYAKARHIEILPEVDLPGHMVAAVAAYPAFSCDSTKQYSVRIDGGISHDVLNIGDDRVIDFLKCVLDHLADVFPYPYVHIGGDECPTEQWSRNADCLRRVEEEGLAGVHELQSWLVEELGNYVKDRHGKDLVVWDELLAHWSSANTVKPVIMAWNHINKSAEAADKGFKSIVVPYQSLYIDFMQVPANQTIVDEPYYGGWGDGFVNTVETVYNLNPLASLSGREDMCMGVQANLWAETLNDFGELQYQLLPRMLALSEIGWLSNSKKNWDDFYKRLQQQDEILDALGYIYAKHYIEPKEQTKFEKLVADVEEALAKSQPGKVGYPAQADFDVLSAALETAKTATDETAALSALQKSFNAYKKADILRPEAGKLFQIVSASTYYKKQFAGSTLYEAGEQVRFHYTPQVEPEELWTFELKEGTSSPQYYLKNVRSGKYLSMPTLNAAVTMTERKTTTLRIDRASIATEPYSYIPGVVVISATSGYRATMTGNVKRLSAQTSGVAFAKDDAALCYSGTWMLVEVEDFKAQLEGLAKKCEWILLTSKPNNIGEPTQEALDFLSEDIVVAARKHLTENAVVSEEIYMQFLALYNAFLAMPRASVLDVLSEKYYYLVQNAYFTDYYAKAVDGAVKPANLDKNDDAMYWRFVKNADGTLTVINKLTDKIAYINAASEGEAVRVDYAGTGMKNWTLMEITTDQGATGIAIVESTGTYSWYINPSAFQNVILKPRDWGASIWNFIKNESMVTAIGNVSVNNSGINYYDLSGRKVLEPSRGLYITSDGKKVLMK